MKGSSGQAAGEPGSLEAWSSSRAARKRPLPLVPGPRLARGRRGARERLSFVSTARARAGSADVLAAAADPGTRPRRAAPGSGGLASGSERWLEPALSRRDRGLRRVLRHSDLPGFPGSVGSGDGGSQPASAFLPASPEEITDPPLSQDSELPAPAPILQIAKFQCPPPTQLQPGEWSVPPPAAPQFQLQASQGSNCPWICSSFSP
ncbi:uncharacterized protein [Sagmatias obliquidens]|uniref:uncharacterized protein n=1 Tax=Sagmatias obliquidens TaxID=3371155 RepID=UPI000F43F217|nr:uncharacterized protein LOC113628573 [Lagenorhynchus obliquidens]